MVTLASIENEVSALRAAANSINGLFATVIAAQTALISSLEAESLTYQVSESQRLFTTLLANIEAAQRALINLSNELFLDRGFLETFPGMTNETDVAEALRELFDKYVTDGEDIPKNTVTLSAITKAPVTACGNLYNTKKLPGNIAPGEGFIAHYNLYDRDSELPETDSFVAVCRTLGSLVLSGHPPQNVPYGQFTTYGNGGSITLVEGGSSNLITNFFETFDTLANLPDGWTALVGAVGTEFQKTTAAGTYMLGTSALRIQGTSELTFPIAALVAPRQMLLLSVWLKKPAGTTSGTYAIRMTGTGMTTITSSTFNATDLSSSLWTEKTLHLKIPASIPTDLVISIVTTTVDTTDGIYLDGGILQPYTYWSGIGWAATLGPVVLALGDKFTGTITNDKAGIIQTWIARAHGFQLPSA